MDQIDGIKEQVGKVEEYLKTLMIWDVSQQLINNLVTALNGAEFQAVLASVNTTSTPTRAV